MIWFSKPDQPRQRSSHPPWAKVRGGDSHGACPRRWRGAGPRRWHGASARAWCERKGIGCIFGLSGNPVLLRQVGPLAEDAALGRLEGEAEKVRRCGEFRCAAKSWNAERRVIARVAAGPQGADSRFIVTNLPGLPKSLYEKVYCARGQAENLIKAHKLHLASDRTACSKATANQFRLLVHTAAYRLMLTLRGLAPKDLLLARCSIRYGPPLPDQGRRARHRDGHPHQGRPAERLSRSGRPRRSRRPHRQAAAVNNGAGRPTANPSAQPQTPVTASPTPPKTTSAARRQAATRSAS